MTHSYSIQVYNFVVQKSKEIFIQLQGTNKFVQA